MFLDIQIDNKRKVSAQMKSGLFEHSFEQQSPLSAIRKLQAMLREERSSHMSIKEYIEIAIESFNVGDTAVIETLGRDIKDFRVRLSTCTKEKKMKFKTKVIDGQLFATRIL